MDEYHSGFPGCSVRRAQRSDVAPIFGLIDSMTADGTLLRRSAREIEQQIETFIVAESASAEFLGCAALHRYGTHLAEVRSIVVEPEARGLGAGGMLLQRLLEDVRTTGTQCACLFTRVPGFFAHYGFHPVPLVALADKVVKDCSHCARRQHCDEIAMAYGVLPSYTAATLAAATHRLVQL